MSHPIEGILDNSLEKIKQMVDVNTVIGNPITTENGIVIIPITKVSYGFASGGSDLPTKNAKELFGGGAGAGITVTPEAFLVINGSDVNILQLTQNSNSVDTAINAVPGIIDKITDLFKKEKTDVEN